MKLKIIGEPGRERLALFFCPGCKTVHPYRIDRQPDQPERVVWQFNGDMERPTFQPSLLVSASMPGQRCHLFLIDGQLRFCADSAHQFAGQTVPCPDWDDARW